VLYQLDCPHGGGHAPALRAAVPEHSINDMRRNDFAQLGAGGAVSLPGAFYGSAEHVAGDNGEDDGVPTHQGVQAVLGDEVEEPGRFPDD
jgi:hypothetical protein